MGLGPDQVAFLGVWIDMLTPDNWPAAEAAASIFEPYAHVAQFHDPGRLIGSAVAASIGAPGRIAWDMYLFYGAGAKWDGEAPRPLDWAHQLGQDDWADPGRYHWREALPPALRSMATAVLGPSAGR
jgi:hypothetical protein